MNTAINLMTKCQLIAVLYQQLREIETWKMLPLKQYMAPILGRQCDLPVSVVYPNVILTSIINKKVHEGKNINNLTIVY